MTDIITYGVNDANAQSTVAVLILLFVGIVLPALIMWFDEDMYVKEIEHDQQTHTAHGHYI